jgi:hypothetical protein
MKIKITNDVRDALKLAEKFPDLPGADSLQKKLSEWKSGAFDKDAIKLVGTFCAKYFREEDGEEYMLVWHGPTDGGGLFTDFKKIKDKSDEYIVDNV